VTVTLGAGWKTYLAAAGIALTGVAKFLGHEINGVELLQTLAEALAVAGFRDVIGRMLAK